MAEGDVETRMRITQQPEASDQPRGLAEPSQSPAAREVSALASSTASAISAGRFTPVVANFMKQVHANVDHDEWGQYRSKGVRNPDEVLLQTFDLNWRPAAPMEAVEFMFCPSTGVARRMVRVTIATVPILEDERRRRANR